MSSGDKFDMAMLDQLSELLGERFAELVERFVVDGQKRIDAIAKAASQQDFDTLHAEAHGLKGSSRNVGANALGDVCARLEELGRIKSNENLATIVAAAEKEFAAFAEVLTHYKS